MTTVNITVEKGDWQNIISLGSLELTEGNSYTLTVLANGESEVCIADTKPNDTFKGHPTNAKTNFTFGYKAGDIVWVRLNAIAGDTGIVVFS